MSCCCCCCRCCWLAAFCCCLLAAAAAAAAAAAGDGGATLVVMVMVIGDGGEGGGTMQCVWRAAQAGAYGAIHLIMCSLEQQDETLRQIYPQLSSISFTVHHPPAACRCRAARRIQYGRRTTEEEQTYRVEQPLLCRVKLDVFFDCVQRRFQV